MGDTINSSPKIPAKPEHSFQIGNALQQMKGDVLSVFYDLPLDRTRRALRLWKFRPDAPDKRHTVCIDLAVFDMQHAPSYTALSYAWGSYDQARTIRVNNGQLKITENLWHFLFVLRRNSKKVDRWFWADQISLDQQNVRERDHQVGLMCDIYTGAVQVFAHLGPAPDTNDLLNTAFSEKRFDPTNPRTEIIMGILFDIFSRPYWTRLWVVQELWLASDVTFWCGRRSLSRDLLRSRYKWAYQGTSTSFVYAYGGSPPLSTEFKALLEKHGKTMELLLKKSNVGRKLDLPQVLQICCNSLCTDPRDKIYGVQALVKPEDRVLVDYSKPHDILVKEVIRDIIVRDPEPRVINYHIAWGQALSWRNVDARIDVMSLLSLRLTQSAEDSCRATRIMYWACMLARIPEHIRTLSPYTRGLKSQLKNFWSLFAKRTITPRQQNFIKYLEEAAHRHVFPWTHMDVVLSNECAVVKKPNKYYTEALAVDAPPAGWLNATVVLERAAAQHGFVMYGDYLCHPEDWPLPDQAPSKVFMFGPNA